jgi:hypothetical protein
MRFRPDFSPALSRAGLDTGLTPVLGEPSFTQVEQQGVHHSGQQFQPEQRPSVCMNFEHQGYTVRGTETEVAHNLSLDYHEGCASADAPETADRGNHQQPEHSQSGFAFDLGGVT